jgi:hypothetical protein
MARKKVPDRPRDAMQLAAHIGKIATGDATDEGPEPVSPVAKRRGEARAKKLSPARRRQIAQRAAKARWKKKG